MGRKQLETFAKELRLLSIPPTAKAMGFLERFFMSGLATYATHFSGVGGACGGMHNAGLRCVLAIDMEQERLDYRERNLGHKGFCMSITDYVPAPEHAADILWTSPPCKKVSSLSRQYVDPNDEMNRLYLKSVEYCDRLRPKYFILENVTGILTFMTGDAKKGGKMPLWEQWRQSFRDLGYHTEWNILNSVFFGVPQDRERVFLVGSRDGKKGLIPYEDTTIRRKFGDIMVKGSTDECWSAQTYETVLKAIARNSAKTETMYEFRLIKPDSILPTLTCSFDGGATRKKTAVIDEKDGAVYLRQPTVREGARAQGFPDYWALPPSRAKAWQFIGDAVSCPVAEAIARHLMRIENGERPPFKKEPTAKRIPQYVRDMHNDFYGDMEMEMESTNVSDVPEELDFRNI